MREARTAAAAAAEEAAKKHEEEAAALREEVSRGKEELEREKAQAGEATEKLKRVSEWDAVSVR